MVGARVIKTCIAIALAILAARFCGLHSPQFAGVVAVLSVHPSIYRSLRNGLQQIISAVLGALAAAVAMYLLGTSFLVMALVAFLLMILHVKWKWTNSLLVSVVIAINTMGSTSLFFGDSALNQMELVLIGTGIGAVVNFVFRPVHEERAEDLLNRSEGMLLALLYYLFHDLQEGKITPYAEMRKQIVEVQTYIERGKEVSKLIAEDQKFHNLPAQEMQKQFHRFENMSERIRDLCKGLQEVDVSKQEAVYCQKAILLTVRIQERGSDRMQKRAAWLQRVLEKHRMSLLYRIQTPEGARILVPYYHLYSYMGDYLELLAS